RVMQLGRLRCGQAGSRRSRKLLPPSVDRLRMLVCDRDVSGQSAKMRFVLIAPDCVPGTPRSTVSCGSPQRKWAETRVAGAKLMPAEVLNVAGGPSRSAGGAPSTGGWVDGAPLS